MLLPLGPNSGTSGTRQEYGNQRYHPLHGVVSRFQWFHTVSMQLIDVPSPELRGVGGS
jgi:hypothetical protein